MLVPPDIRELHSPHLRLWRAWEQIQMLESHIARWLHCGGYRFDRQTDSDGRLHLRIRFNSLPAEWSLLLGEALHSMRSSLDHLVYGLAILEQGRALTDDEARKTEFPIFGPEALTDGLRTRKVGLLPEPVQLAIAQYQPHNASDYRMTKLWTLHTLDNRNKHRAIEPQLVSYRSLMPDVPFTGDAIVVTPGSPLHDGLEILSGTPADPERDARVVAAMSVVFPWHDPITAGTVEGIGVVRVLFDLHEHVRSIHEHLLGIAGYLVPFPGSNAPSAAQEEDLKRHEEFFKTSIAD